VLTRRTPQSWYIGFGVAFLLVMVLFYAIGYLLMKGIGIWGVNSPVGWGFAIINFVWWIGIGHAGTLISAILLLLLEWRTSINRFAEAMTLFAVACAGLFSLLHVGRPWLAYWLLPGVRSNVKALFAVAMAVNLGMWLERYIIVMTSLHRDFLPSAWGMDAGTVWN
jgi:Ni/Fe-hydrogenase subunit HybB-like protein